MLLGLMVSACTTTEKAVEQPSATAQETTQTTPQITDTDMWQATSAPTDTTEATCTHCDVSVQQKEMEDIYSEAAEQAAKTNKTVEEFLVAPSVLQN